MKFGRLLCLFLLLTFAGCKAPRERLADKCRESAGIVVHDPIKWQAYVAEVMKADEQVQRSIATGRRAGSIMAPPDTEQFIRPFPYVPGYDIVRQHDNSHGSIEPTDTPRTNNKEIFYLGRSIATLHDYDVKQSHFGYSEMLDCSNTYPAVYGIKRRVVGTASSATDF